MVEPTYINHNNIIFFISIGLCGYIILFHCLVNIYKNCSILNLRNNQLDNQLENQLDNQLDNHLDISNESNEEHYEELCETNIGTNTIINIKNNENDELPSYSDLLRNKQLYC